MRTLPIIIQKESFNYETSFGWRCQWGNEPMVHEKGRQRNASRLLSRKKPIVHSEREELLETVLHLFTSDLRYRVTMVSFWTRFQETITTMLFFSLVFPTPSLMCVLTDEVCGSPSLLRSPTDYAFRAPSFSCLPTDEVCGTPLLLCLSTEQDFCTPSLWSLPTDHAYHAPSFLCLPTDEVCGTPSLLCLPTDQTCRNRQELQELQELQEYAGIGRKCRNSWSFHIHGIPEFQNGIATFFA